MPLFPELHSFKACIVSHLHEQSIFIFLCPPYMNSLPLDVHNAESLSIFKSSLNGCTVHSNGTVCT